jgi:sugar phosphate isomerase/epimerase
MRTIKGPGLFIAQFADAKAPFNNLANIAAWAKGLGYVGLQLPTWDIRFLDVKKAAASGAYADEIKGVMANAGLVITDLSSHIFGQVVAVHPAYDGWMDGLCPPEVRGNPTARQAWATEMMKTSISAASRLGVTELGTFSGGVLWPFLYPWPQRPDGLVEEGFAELARLWKPILDHAETEGVDLCFEIHPMEDLCDGVSFEMFLEQVGNHPRCNINYDASHFIKQGLDYLEFVDFYHSRIKSWHVKDAEFNPTGKQGFYSGFLPWVKRAARDRSLGDGQVNFRRLFAKFTEYDFAGWAVYEWEDCMESPAEAAKKGAIFIREHIITVTDKVFDDFAGAKGDRASNRTMLGLK